MGLCEVGVGVDVYSVYALCWHEVEVGLVGHGAGMSEFCLDGQCGCIIKGGYLMPWKRRYLHKRVLEASGDAEVVD
ncbi:hypothetical protein Tco_1230742 [Tanacetum coccineum]